MARSKKRVWGFDDAGRELLLDATAEIPELRALVVRAEQRADFNGLWLVKSNADELDDMYSLVSALMDSTRSRKKLDLLDGMLASLCTAIDGF
jgi:hypothetical protein